MIILTLNYFFELQIYNSYYPSSMSSSNPTQSVNANKNSLNVIRPSLLQFISSTPKNYLNYQKLQN
jgi:hypothetical protein